MIDNIIKREIIKQDLEEKIENTRQKILILGPKILELAEASNKDYERTRRINCILIILTILTLSLPIFFL